MVKDVPYGWKIPAKAALRWSKEAQKHIEARIAEIGNDPGHKEEYLEAKATWQALRSAEVKISAELNNRK